jgi:hypothetical protein
LSAEPQRHVVYRRALASGSVTLAVVTAAQPGALTLEDAFDLTLLPARREQQRYGRAAAS